jgi:hypothetical protein
MKCLAQAQRIGHLRAEDKPWLKTLLQSTFLMLPLLQATTRLQNTFQAHPFLKSSRWIKYLLRVEAQSHSWVLAVT